MEYPACACLTLDLLYPCHVSKLGGSIFFPFEAILLWTATFDVFFVGLFYFSYIFK